MLNPSWPCHVLLIQSVLIHESVSPWITLRSLIISLPEAGHHNDPCLQLDAASLNVNESILITATYHDKFFTQLWNKFTMHKVCDSIFCRIALEVLHTFNREPFWSVTLSFWQEIIRLSQLHVSPRWGYNSTITRSWNLDYQVVWWVEILLIQLSIRLYGQSEP